MFYKNCLTRLKAIFFHKQDLNRQVVKSDAASFTIPELEFESPAFSQKGGKVDNSSFLLSCACILTTEIGFLDTILIGAQKLVTCSQKMN